VARHERCYERHQQVLELEHYLDVLAEEARRLAGSTALEQCRAQGRWPASYDRFWARVSEREGRQAGTRAMIEVLLLSRTYGAARVRQAVEEALGMGTCSLSAIRYLLSVDCLPADFRSGCGGDRRSCAAMTVRNPAWRPTNNCDRTGQRLRRQTQVRGWQTGRWRRRWSSEYIPTDPTGHHSAVRPATLSDNHGRPVCQPGRRGSAQRSSRT
jgi:hypothetical protein